MIPDVMKYDVVLENLLDFFQLKNDKAKIQEFESLSGPPPSRG